MRVLILGASGMLGNAMMRVLSAQSDWDVHGTVRGPSAKRYFPPATAARLHQGIDIEDQDTLLSIFSTIRPRLVVNCIGQVKQVENANDPLRAIPINALLPHRLARLCQLSGARLIHISTDCVFSGARGGYRETDTPDATDLYGRAKLLGEVDYPHAITLRTSIIGHELQSAHGLVEWFLSQKDACPGYTRAIFSGLPTVTLATVIRDIVAPRPELHGVYHVSAAAISKFDLLQLIAKTYGKKINIIPDDHIRIDRSLDSSKFAGATGFVAPDWEKLITQMYRHHEGFQHVQ